jgi:hypothetical protein
MKIVTASIMALFAIAMTCQSQAETLTIASPNQGQTRSQSSIFRSGLHWNKSQQKFTAVITFSNANYIAEADRQDQDTFIFELPGVLFDSEKNVFYAVSESGQRMPIAESKRVFFGKAIELLPSATIYAEKNRGNVTVKLVVTDGRTPDSRWIEVNGRLGQ